MERLARSELLVGPVAMEALHRTRVILFGVGGVGGWCAEALVRSGVGHLTMVDPDRVTEIDINRQIEATPDAVGCLKVEALATRLRAIAPDAEIRADPRPFCPTTRDSFRFSDHDYVLDAIDSLSPKLHLIMDALAAGVRLYSSMGAASRLDPTRVRTGSIWESSGCPLARRIRRRLRRHGVDGDFQVVYSDELLLNHGQPPGDRHVVGSMVTVTATFGMCLASLVINDVITRAGAYPARRFIKGGADDLED